MAPFEWGEDFWPTGYRHLYHQLQILEIGQQTLNTSINISVAYPPLEQPGSQGKTFASFGHTHVSRI